MDHVVGIHHNWPARRRPCRSVRGGVESTTRRHASELSMHSVKRRKPAQRKVNRDRR
jgi:hypothetical protein